MMVVARSFLEARKKSKQGREKIASGKKIKEKEPKWDNSHHLKPKNCNKIMKIKWPQISSTHIKYFIYK